MCCSNEYFKYNSIEDALNIFNMRVFIVEMAKNMRSNNIIFMPGNTMIGNTKFENGAWNVGTYWRNHNSLINNLSFIQLNNTSSFYAVSLTGITPYHGDCLGAVQVCVFNSASIVNGMENFDLIHNNNPINFGVVTYNSYEKHIYDSIDKKTFIPGDHMYMKNHDDYHENYKDGFWAGEHCIYTGIESDIGYFYGSGLIGKQSESDLRDRLVIEFEKDGYDIGDPMINVRFTMYFRIKTGR